MFLATNKNCLVKGFFFLDFIYFLNRGREKNGEKHQCVLASWATPTRTWLATQACALTGNRTCKPLVHSLVLNPLSHTNQGACWALKKQQQQQQKTFITQALPRTSYLGISGTNIYCLLRCLFSSSMLGNYCASLLGCRTVVWWHIYPGYGIW